MNPTTTHPSGPPMLRSPDDEPPPGGRASEADRSRRRAAVTAGAALLVMVVLAMTGALTVAPPFTEGDPAQTAIDIRASETWFRLGIVCLFGVVALDVLVACALYRVFRPAGESIALLAGAFRVAYAGVFLVAISRLVTTVEVLGSEAQQVAFSPEQVHAQALAAMTGFFDLWHLGFVLFGLHLVLVGYLACRARGVPTLLGVLVLIGGVGYAADGVLVALVAEPAVTLHQFVFVGEALLALWLVVRGRRMRTPERDPASALASS